MTWRILPRVGIVALAAVAVSWLAYDLRAMSLDGQGRAEARVARQGPEVDRALSSFARAAHGNADPMPRIDEARFLLGLGRDRQAADVLDSVVRANPGNVQAWSLLAAATASTNPSRSAAAGEQLRLLFGHPAGYRLSTAGVVRLGPPRVLGSVDIVRILGKVVEFVGWSATVAEQPAGGVSLVPSPSILIVADGRLVATGAPRYARPDVSRGLGGPRTRVGFTIVIPLARLRRGGRRPEVRVFGGTASASTRLPVNCRPRAQAFGCG